MFIRVFWGLFIALFFIVGGLSAQENASEEKKAQEETVGMVEKKASEGSSETLVNLVPTKSLSGGRWFTLLNFGVSLGGANVGLLSSSQSASSIVSVPGGPSVEYYPSTEITAAVTAELASAYGWHLTSSGSTFHGAEMALGVYSESILRGFTLTKNKDEKDLKADAGILSFAFKLSPRYFQHYSLDDARVALGFSWFIGPNFLFGTHADNPQVINEHDLLEENSKELKGDFMSFGVDAGIRFNVGFLSLGWISSIGTDQYPTVGVTLGFLF